MLTWIATALVVSCLASFGWYLVSLHRLSTTRQPELRVFRRSGGRWRAEHVEPPPDD